MIQSHKHVRMSAIRPSRVTAKISLPWQYLAYLIQIGPKAAWQFLFDNLNSEGKDLKMRQKTKKSDTM
jgi:hypothetical protein